MLVPWEKLKFYITITVNGAYFVLFVEHITWRWLRMLLFCVSSEYGKIVEIIDSEEGPCEVVSHAYVLDPSGLCGETCCDVEIVERWIKYGDLVDIVDGFQWAWSLMDEILRLI